MDQPRTDLMPCNSTTMIRTARQEFDQILDSLHAQARAGATAYQAEQNLFAQLLALGRLLLEIFFALCTERSAKQTVRSTDGTVLRIHSWKQRRYVSLFGATRIERPYFWAKGKGGQIPTDEALSLPGDSYSDLLREQADLLSAQMAYGQTAAVLEHLLGLSLSTSALTRLVERDGKEVVAFYREVPESRPESRAEEPILVVQADGKGVPMRPSAERSGPEKHAGTDKRGERPPVRLGKGQKRTKKKEAVVTSLYATDRRVRTAEEVLDSFFSPPNASSKTSSRAGPQDGKAQTGASLNGTGPASQNKKVWATLEGKEVALARLDRQVRKREESSREESSISDRVALSDGCRALQDQLCEQFPRFELILDFVHVSEYLWKAANALFEETGEARLDWVLARSRELLTGRLEKVLATLRRESERKTDTFAQVARYFERNAKRMDYARYLAKGWPIATGVIEGACRHLVKDRCEASGMRWNAQGAEQVLALRAVWINGDWDAYHLRRRKQRHRQLYGSPLDTTDTLEEQMWRMAA